jgi:predicted MPP superfamily phosphohydrolase
MPFGAPAITTMIVWLATSAALMPLGFLAHRIKRQPLSDLLAWAGLLSMGSFSSLMVLTIIRDMALLVASAITAFFFNGASLQPFEKWSAITTPGLAALLTLVGLVNARRRAKIRSVDVPITNLPVALDGFTIAQISDVHIGPTIKRNYVDAIVDAVNDLNVDMIAVTGDLVDGSVKQLSLHVEPLSRLSARHGAYFVTGNHEYYSGAMAWIQEFQRLGLRVLINEHVVLQHDGAIVVVAGVTDYSAHYYEASHQSDPVGAIADAPANAAVNLLLAHQPRSALAAEPAGYQLQLSGHTHGGQFFPWNFFVRFQQPFTSGLHRLGNLWVYTSRGTGYWGPPKRLGAPSEITRIRLVRW